MAHVRRLDHEMVGVGLGCWGLAVHAVSEELVTGRHPIMMRVSVMVGVLMVARRRRRGVI